ncbi:hypothetical protein pdam_00020092 [Pocillopora damicornis]|uniref:FYVE-type domain-containing protein n=1 Tax=Pocillopora damicornis TaxID=46731 RepID=A0A3M6UJY0_POCDA|nr:hypothetical protein pdam_00020092 [Pocillopora damicornis]
MFKRWRDKKKDNEQQESPANTKQAQSPNETSGFICPVCMISFNSPEDLQVHFETSHDDSEPAPTSGDFICPLCMKKFNGPGELQSHFDQVHETQNDSSAIKPSDAHLSKSLPADTTKVWNERHGSLLSFDEELPVPRKESEVSRLSNQLKELEDKTQEIMYLQQELNELNASLKEEKWYSAALKEEVDKMTKEKVELEEKVSSLEMEKQTLEKDSERKLMDEKENSVKSYFSSLPITPNDAMAEFAQLKVELAKALEAQTGSQSEQMNLAQRTSQLATENAGLKATLEEEKKQQNAYSEEISRLKEQLEDKTRLNENLEKQLSQRPSGDEVITLQNQLSTAQQQVASLRQEKEQEHKSWQEKFNATLTEVNSLQMKVKELEVEKAAKIEQVQSLQTAVTASTENRKQAQEQNQEQQRNLINLQHDLSQANVVLKERETFIEYLQKQLNEAKGKLDSEEESNQQVRNLQNQLEEEQRQAQNRELSIKDLESSLQQKKDDIARFEEERTDLIAKIEAGGGAETVIEQLKQEKESYQTRLQQLEATLQTQTQEHSKKIEEMHKQQKKVEEELAKEKDNTAKLENTVTDLTSQCTISLQQTEEFRKEVKEKSESLVALEAAKAAEKSVLDEQVRSSQETLQEKVKELSALQQKNVKLKEDYDSIRESHTKLEIQVKTSEMELENHAKRAAQLEAEMKGKVEVMTLLQQEKASEKSSLEKQIDDAQQSLSKKEKEILVLRGELQQYKEKSAESVKSLENEKEQLSLNLTSTKTLLEEKEKLISNLGSEQQDARKEIISLKEQLASTSQLDLKNLLRAVFNWMSKSKTKVISVTNRSVEMKHLFHVNALRAAETIYFIDCCDRYVSQSLKEKTDQMESANKQYVQEKQTLEAKLSELDASSKNQVSELMGTLKNVKEKLKEKEEMCNKQVEECQQLQSKIQQVEQEKSSVQEAMTELGKAHHERIIVLESEFSAKESKLHEQIAEKEKIASELQKSLEQKEERMNGMQRKIEVLEEELKKECESCKNYEAQLCKLQISSKEAQEKIVRLEKEQEDARSDIKDLQNQVTAGDEELGQFKRQAEEIESNLRQTVEQLNEAKNALETQVLHLDGDLIASRQLTQKTKEERDSFEQELESQRQALNELRTSLQTKIAELEKNVAAEQDAKEKALQEAQEKQQLLIKQKLDLENKLANSEKDLQKAIEEHEETKEVSKRVQLLLKEETAAVQTKLANETQELEELKKSKEQMETRLNIQISSLNENLAAARTEAEKFQQETREAGEKLADAENRNDDLQGEIAVLEATVQNNLDERRKLLERCVAGDEAIEKQKKEISELNRKVENAQAAMMELTQENQSLQITTNQKNARRWESDNDVAACNGCDKQFSLKIRKHHCRNCGLIYCSDCTAKSAPLTSSKKPVRVCDKCFDEVTSGTAKVQTKASAKKTSQKTQKLPPDGCESSEFVM